MAGYRVPNIYIRYAAEPRQLQRRLTSVTGFIGLAQRGPVNSPQRVTSWSQFKEIFGGFVYGHYLAPAVYGFFANGGRICHIVRVADMQNSENKAVTATYRVFRNDGRAVMRVSAANEGEWGNQIDLRFIPASERMVLTELSMAAVAGENELSLQSTVDLYPGCEITIVDSEGTILREESMVDDVLTNSRVRLRSALYKSFKKGSLIIGYGLDLEIRNENRHEKFEQLSLNPDHSCYIEDIVNGDPATKSYVDKVAAGHSILARLRITATGLPPRLRPLRGVDATSEEDLSTLPEGLTFPKDLASRICYDADNLRLVFRGVMSEREKDRLLALSDRSSYRDAVAALYTKSQADTVARETDGKDPQLPINVRYFTGYDRGAYFPYSNPVADGFQGLASMELIEEVDLIAIPDLAHSIEDTGGVSSYSLGQRHMLYHCEKTGNRFAILDSPPSVDSVTSELVEDIGYMPAAVNGAIYFPWLRMRATGEYDTKQAEQYLPPSGFVAGVYARTDALEGVHRSPANEALREVYELQYSIDDTTQDRLNTIGVNCIRAFPGRGIRVWGSRTLSRSDNWRYVAVRRTMLVIKKEIQRSLQWAVFEPNDSQLRRKIAAALGGYLNGLYQANVLAGETPEEAYYVRCDETSNSPESIARGEVIAEVGFAPVYPAEFIILTVKRTAEAIAVLP